MYTLLVLSIMIFM